MFSSPQFSLITLNRIEIQLQKSTSFFAQSWMNITNNDIITNNNDIIPPLLMIRWRKRWRGGEKNNNTNSTSKEIRVNKYIKKGTDK